MVKTFKHDVNDIGEGYIPFKTDASPPAKIRMSVDADGHFWFSANREGYLYIARVFAEIGLREFKGGFHFHKNSDFHFAPEKRSSEFSFGLIEDEA